MVERTSRERAWRASVERAIVQARLARETPAKSESESCGTQIGTVSPVRTTTLILTRIECATTTTSSQSHWQTSTVKINANLNCTCWLRLDTDTAIIGNAASITTQADNLGGCAPEGTALELVRGQKLGGSIESIARKVGILINVHCETSVGTVPVNLLF
jgi:hypothetical protein